MTTDTFLVGQNPVTIENLETHPKNPMIARVFVKFVGSDKTGGYYLTQEAKKRLQTP